MKRVEAGLSSNLWIDAEQREIVLLWASQSHVEIYLPGPTGLAREKMCALVVAGFVSLPMRVESSYGGNVVLRFVQQPHRSVLDLVHRELLANEIDATRGDKEELAKPYNPHADLDAWSMEAGDWDERDIAEEHRKVSAA